MAIKGWGWDALHPRARWVVALALSFLVDGADATLAQREGPTTVCETCDDPENPIAELYYTSDNKADTVGVRFCTECLADIIDSIDGVVEGNEDVLLGPSL